MKLPIMVIALLVIGISTSVIPLGQLAIPSSEKEAVPMGSVMTPPIYAVEASIDPDLLQIEGKMKVTFTPVDAKQVFFHLYPNAFREVKGKGHEEWRKLLGENPKPGGIDIFDVKVMGKSATANLQGADRTILHIPLAGTTSKRMEVDMSFRLQVPKNNGRMSYDKHAIWLGNWLPILALKDAAGWRLDPYTPIGDPFYSETADYQVKISVPASYSIATTGYENQASVTQFASSNRREYSIKADNVRDFALVVLDDTYKKSVAKQNGTTINTWYQTTDNAFRVQNLHQTAAASLAYYSAQFGAYPYPEYDVVKTGGFFGGMEYPGIAFIERSFFQLKTPYVNALEVVAHETAHQWFYGLVGNDQFHEPWVDESLATYASLAFMNQYEPNISQHVLFRRIASGELAAEYAKAGLTARDAVTDFPDMKSYSQLVYSRGASMLWELREAWGESRVHGVLKQYVSDKQFKNATGPDVMEAFSKAAGVDAQAYFDYWLGGELGKLAQAEVWRRILSEKSE